MMLLAPRTRTAIVPLNPVRLAAKLAIPVRPRGTVIFVHGSSGDRHDLWNRPVVQELWNGHFATLSFESHPAIERVTNASSGAFSFDMETLGLRVASTIDWVLHQPELADRPVMLFGTNTGSAAALAAAVYRPHVTAVVSRCGRPDLAGDMLARVRAPTLLIVADGASMVASLNREALLRMTCVRQLMVVPDADATGTQRPKLRGLASLTRRWFEDHLPLNDGVQPSAPPTGRP
jgi:hypothetical protein